MIIGTVALVMLGAIGTVAMVMLGAASLPALFILLYVYKKDRTEPEPGSLLFHLVLLGFLAAVIAIIAEFIGELFLSFFEFPTVTDRNFWDYFFVVALSEEFFKYILMRKRTWKEIFFNCSFDGVVYAVFISLGFAILENFLYVFDGGIVTALIRAVTAIPGHASFGVFMGIFYAMARKEKNDGNNGKSAVFEVLAVVVPIMIHGFYDFATTLEGAGIFILFIAVLFAVAFFLIRIMSKADSNIINPEQFATRAVSVAPEVSEKPAEVPNDSTPEESKRVIISPARPSADVKLTNYRTGRSSNKTDDQ